jgi:subtilisin family serine protease
MRSDGWALLWSLLVATLIVMSGASSPAPSPAGDPALSSRSLELPEGPQAKLDPLLRLLLHRAQHEPQLDLARFAPLAAVYGPSAQTPLTAREGPGVRVGVLIKTRGSLPQLGLRPLARDLFSARVTLEELRELAQLPEVVFIEADYRLEPHIDRSVPAVGGRLLHELLPAATGRGVIVGFVDTGIDWTHRDFRVDRDGDGFEESSRILWLVNLSLGGHFGPHDGTSLFEQSLEALLERPGRAIVASAGNDGDRTIHMGGQLRPREAFTFTFVPQQENAYVNIWYSGSANFTVSVTSPGINGPPQTVLAVRGQGEFQNTPDGSVEIDNSGGGIDPRNRDRAIAISLERVQPGSRWSITLTDQGGTGGRFDAWPGLSDMGYFPEGDSFATVTEPATAKKIIAVGAYTTKIFWTGMDGQPHRFTDAQSEGQLAPFSSRGPTRDGRIKPDLTAPGTAIVSALAKNSEVSQSTKLVLPGGEYAAMQGTSMAAPHVAGAAALLLQAQPTLTAEGILAQLKSTALHDAFTTDPRAWGAGKLKVDRGFETLGLQEQLSAGRPALKIGPNPATRSVTLFYSTVGSPSTVELLVFDLVGRLVYKRQLPTEGSRFQWGLHDRENKPLAPGLYLVVVSADGRPSAPYPLVVRK